MLYSSNKSYGFEFIKKHWVVVTNFGVKSWMESTYKYKFIIKLIFVFFDLNKKFYGVRNINTCTL